MAAPESGVSRESYSESLYRSIERYSREKDVDGLMRTFEEVWAAPECQSWMYQMIPLLSDTLITVAKYGTVDQIDAILNHAPNESRECISIAFTAVIIAQRARGNHAAAQHLRGSEFFTERAVLLYRYLYNDWAVDWYFEDFTWDALGAERGALRRPLDLFGRFNAHYEIYLKYFDAIDAAAPAGSKDLTGVYMLLVQKCLRMGNRVMYPIDTGLLLARHILEKRAIDADVFAPNSERGTTLLCGAARTRDARCIALVLEFVDPSVKFMRAIKSGLTPLGAYEKIATCYGERHSEEIVALLSPLPAKGAHE